MKRLFLILVAVLSFSAAASAQCGDELMKAALAAMGDKQYIKDFDVKLAGGTPDTKFSVVLNSRTKYQINVAAAASNSEGVIFEIYEGDKLIGTNSAGGKMYPVFQFICSKTAAYKLRARTANGSEACARAVLSLVQQYSEAEMP